ncbi:lytic transglycosylase [Chitinimonas naiadis]
MPKIQFRIAPLFALIAALFAPLSQADETVLPAVETTSPQPQATPLSLPVTDLPVATEPTSPLIAPADQTDLWARVRQGFKMEESDSPAVRAQERFYANNPKYIQRVVERSRRYLYFIVGEVEKRGMPTEIALLPIVESAFIPKAESHASASGLWQFIPSTGQRYGLERTWWYDGRQDVMAATYAALDYLQDLYNLFGDWQLALAAYNWGEGGVGRALAKTRARGMDDDFDTIRKPRETESYVPKLLAVRNIIANPAAYGLSIPAMPNQPYFQPVSTGKHMDLQLAAKLAGTTVEELLQLNPGLIRPVFAHKDDRKLLLPVDKVDAFERNLQSYDKPLLSWQPYVTKRGESLEAIAGKFGIPVAELRDVNKLSGARAANGQTILVPIRDSVDVSERQNLAALIVGAGQPVDPVTVVTAVSASYTVKRGDTLFSIANRHGVSAEQLKKINGLKTNKVEVGRKLILRDVDSKPGLRQAKVETRGGAKTVKYVVRRGDTLDTIARKHDVSVADLRKWNKVGNKASALKVGYKLEIHDNG